MKETIELDLKDICKVLLKRIWIIALCALIAGTSVFAYVTTTVPDRYRAKVTLYINNKEEGGSNVTSANLTVAQKLVNTYGTLIQSDLILEQVIEKTGILRTPAQVRGMVSTASVNGTEIFAVYVTSQNRQEAAQIANAIAEIAPKEISSIIEGSSAKPVDLAKVPSTPISNQRGSKAMLGAAVGALLAAAFFVLRHLLDTHVKTEEELERISGLPVLGTIPDFAVAPKDTKKKARR